MSVPFLSLIIPAHNEEHRLPSTLEQAFSYLSRQSYLAEVLVVENGSQDRTLQIAQEFAAEHSQLRVLTETARGKGLAVKRGMLEAQGEYRFMCDADLSMPIEEVNHFLPPTLTGFDLAIASREASGAIRYNEPSYRHLGGRMINLMIRSLVLPGLHDTQCGFKCFHSSVVQDLFNSLTLAGLSFDIELLYVARLRGYRLAEVPISWYFKAESKVNPLRDALRMGADVITIRRNAKRGVYERRAV